MITLSTDENVSFLINVLEQVVEECKSNISKLKLLINVKRDTAILNKIHKYIILLEEDEVIKFNFPSKSSNSDFLYYSQSSCDEDEPKPINNEYRKNIIKEDALDNFNPVLQFKNALFSVTSFCSSVPPLSGVNKINVLNPPCPYKEYSSADSSSQLDELGCMTFGISNFKSTPYNLRPTNSDSFITVNENDFNILEKIESASADGCTSPTQNILSNRISFNILYKKEVLFLEEFTKSCKKAINIFNQIISDTNKFKTAIKNKTKDIMSSYNIRNKQWGKIRANHVKNGKYLELCLGDSKGPYEIEGDIAGIVNGPTSKSILAYIVYVNSEYELSEVANKAKIFIGHLELTFKKIFSSFVKYYNEKIYRPSCEVLKFFVNLSDRNEFYNIHSPFSDKMYDESNNNKISKAYVDKLEKLNRLRRLWVKYFTLRSEKFEINPPLLSVLSSFPVAGIDISFFFLNIHIYYKSHKLKLMTPKDRLITSPNSSPQISCSSRSISSSVNLNSNLQADDLVVRMPTFSECKPFLPFSDVLVDAIKPFKDILPDDIINSLYQSEDEVSKDVMSEDAETESSDIADKQTAVASYAPGNDSSASFSGIRLMNRWLDPAFYNAVNSTLSDHVFEYSKCYKFQAKARLCYHHSYLNMSFSKGDIVKVQEPVGDIWWGSANGIAGPFPAKCLDTRWLVGIKVDYKKSTELDLYITTPNDEVAETTDINDVGVSLFEKFKIPENCIGSFSCALHKKILLQGRIYISKNYLAFSSHFNDSTLFGEATTLVVPISSIKSVKKGTKKIFSQSIEVDCVENVYIFSSFISRNKVLDIIQLLIKLKTPERNSYLSLNYNPSPKSVKLKVPPELEKFEIFCDGYNQLENVAFELTVPMLIEDVFDSLFDLSQSPHRSIRELMNHENLFYCVGEGEKVDALQNSDDLKVNWSSLPSVAKITLFYRIQVKHSSFGSMLGVPSKGDVKECITFYFIDESHVLVESYTNVSGLPLSDSFHSVWHIILKGKGPITTITGYYQAFIDHWIPFSSRVLTEAQTNLKQALECFADSAYQKMST